MNSERQTLEDALDELLDEPLEDVEAENLLHNRGVQHAKDLLGKSIPPTEEGGLLIEPSSSPESASPSKNSKGTSSSKRKSLRPSVDARTQEVVTEGRSQSPKVGCKELDSQKESGGAG